MLLFAPASNAETGNEQFDHAVSTGSVLEVKVEDQIIHFPTTKDSEVRMLQFASIGIPAGLSAQSIQQGLELVSLGSDVTLTTRLLLALQGMIKNQSRQKLSDGIDVFNNLIDSVDDSNLSKLVKNRNFIEIRSILESARVAQGS